MRLTPARLSAFLVLVFGVKLAIAWQLKDHLLLQPDTTMDTGVYVGLARRVMAGDWALGPGLYYVSPLYIYFLALVGGLAKSLTAVRLVQVLLGTLAVGMLMLTARAWFGSRAAWLAGAFAALTGLFTFYEVVLLQASLDPFLTAAALLLVTFALHRLTWWWFVAAGAALGVGVLNRPNMLAAAAGLILLLAVRRRWTAALFLTAGLAVGVAPVAIRNLAVSHQWTLVSSHGGLNFLIGNGPDANGLFRPVAGVAPTIEGQISDTRRVAEAALARPLTDAEVSAYFSDQAWHWIAGHPVAWIALMARKLWFLFNAQHIALPLSYPFYAEDAKTGLRFLPIGPWLLLPLGVFGLIAAAPRDRRADYLTWLSFVPTYAGSVALFFVSERYRLPLLVPLAIGAGAAADWWLRLLAAGVRRPLVAGGVALAAVGVVNNWPLRLPDGDGREEERVHFAENLARRGQTADAEHWLALALEQYPYPAAAELRVGRQLAFAQQWDAAGRHLTEAVRLGAEPAEIEVDVWLKLGRLAVEARAPDVAEQFFRRAASMAPASAAARLQFGLSLLLLRRFDEAARELGAAVQLDPRSADSLANLAYCEIQLGRPADARRHVEAALAIEPAHPLAVQLRAALGRVD